MPPSWSTCWGEGVLQHGEDGAPVDGWVEHTFRHAAVTTIYGGTSEMQRSSSPNGDSVSRDPAADDRMAERANSIDATGGPGIELVDREACMGSGNCLYWAPAVFELDDDGVAVVSGEVAGHGDQIRSAAQNCPTRAIRLDAFDD